MSATNAANAEVHLTKKNISSKKPSFEKDSDNLLTTICKHALFCDVMVEPQEVKSHTGNHFNCPLLPLDVTKPGTPGYFSAPISAK